MTVSSSSVAESVAVGEVVAEFLGRLLVRTHARELRVHPQGLVRLVHHPRLRPDQ